MADGGDILGSVEVEVRANLDKLLAGFAQGQAAAARFDKAVGEKSAAAAKRFDDATAASAGSLSKQNAAAKASAEAVQAGAAASDRAASEMERSATAASKVDDATLRAAGSMETLGSSADAAGSTVQSNMDGIAGSVGSIDTQSGIAAASMDNLASATGAAADAASGEANAASSVTDVLGSQSEAADSLGDSKEHAEHATEGHAKAAEHAETAVHGETKAIKDASGSLAEVDQSTIKASGSLENLKGAAHGVGAGIKDEVRAISDMGIAVGREGSMSTMTIHRMNAAIQEAERASNAEAKASGTAAVAIRQQAAAEADAAIATKAKAAAAAQSTQSTNAEAIATKGVGMAAGAAAGELNKQAAAEGATAASADKAAGAIKREENALDGSAAAIAKKVQGDSALKASMLRMIQSYDKTHVAAARYEQDLQDIARLEKAGVISSRQAARYTREAGKAYDQAAKATRGLGNATRTASRGLSAFQAILGAVTVGSLIAAGQRALEFARNIKVMSEELGMTTDQFQEWQYIAQQSNVTQSEMEVGFRQLSKTISEAGAGSKQESALMKILGVDMKALKEGTVSVNEVLPLLADKMKGVRSETIQTALAQAYMGESGQKMIAMLSGGSERIDELRKAVHELGGVMSEDEIQNADETARKLAQVKTVLQAQFAGVVSKNSGAILGFASALGTLTNALIKFMSTDPATALGLLGAVIGASKGGIAGMAIGASAGIVAGMAINKKRQDNSNDIGLRLTKFREARENYASLKNQTPSQRQSISGSADRKFYRDEFVKEGKALQRALAEHVARKADGTKPPATAEQKKHDAQVNKELQEALNPDRKKKDTSAADAKRAEKERLRAEKDALRDQRAYQAELDQSESEFLGLQQELTTDVSAIADLKLKQIDIAQRTKDREIEYDQAMGDINEAQAQTLKADVQRNLDIERELVIRDRDAKLAEESYEGKKAALENQLEMLDKDQALAKTSSERREIALKILDAQYELARLALQQIIDNKDISDKDRAIAQAKQDQLEALKAKDVQSAKEQTAGPWEQLKGDLEKTPQQIDEELQGIAAGGVRTLIDGLAEAQLNFKKMGDVAKQVLNQIVTDLIRMQLQAAMSGILGGQLGGGGGGGLFGSLLKLGTSALGGGSLGGLGGFGSATMGSVSAPLGINLGAGSLFDSIPMTVLHDGAINAHAGSGPMRSLPAQAFIGAPRYHKGLGIKGDEFPAILQKGETIIPKGKFGRGGGARGSGGLHMSIGAINVSGAMNNRDARMTARQIVSETQGRMALASRYGFKKK